MARLPIPGSDEGNWGDILNNFLATEHNSDGTLKSSGTLGAKEDITAKGQPNGYASLDGTGKVPASQLPTASSGDPAMGGDLSGTASNAQIVAGAVADTEVAAGANIAQSKIAGLSASLSGKTDTTRQVSTTNSLTGGGDLSANRTLSLVNDSATPGNSSYYGTDGTGTKGFYSLPTVTVEDLPAGSTLTVAKSAGVWPSRPTARADIIVQWKGPDPSPAIVSSGTGGMLDNVDIRLVHP